MSDILALLFAVVVGLGFLPKYVEMQHTSSENARFAITAQQQKKLIEVGTDYVKQNVAAIQAVATAATPAIITVPMLQAPTVKLLDSTFSATNPFGQTWQIQVLQPSAGNLRVLTMTVGGTPLKDVQLGKIMALVGASGGMIPQNDSGVYPGGASNAYGMAAGWGPLPTAGFTSVAGGHLAALTTFNSGQLVSNFLYRNAVPGQPQLNTMNTPLILGAGTVQTSGSACTAADLGSLGRDASTNVLMCDGTKWKTQGSAFWQDPVSTYAVLNSTYPCTAATAWQTRIVQTPTTGTGPRAYICNGTTTSWAAVAADDSGNMTIAGSLTTAKLKLTDVVTAGNRCSDNTAAAPGAADFALNGAVSRDATGLTLSCQSGVWVGQGLGYGQIWQSLLGSSNGCAGPRGFGVTCTNGTGRPIYLAISTNVSTAVGGACLFVSGINLGCGQTAAGGSTEYSFLSGVVPPGAPYYVFQANSGTLVTWAEMR